MRLDYVMKYSGFIYNNEKRYIQIAPILKSFQFIWLASIYM